MTKVAQEQASKASTALSPAEWLTYAESKTGSYQVYINDVPLLHYGVSYEIALGAFAQYAPRGGRVVLVEAGTR